MSRESNEQGRSGRKGADASRTEGRGKQPRQGSDRTEVYGAGKRERDHHFEPGHAPSEQGEMDHRSPEVIKEHQQGLSSGHGAGHHGARDARSDRTQEAAARGEPRSEQVRHGRQHLPGDRS
jgi:hypothetical protein